MTMTVVQELKSVKDVLILALIEVEYLEGEIKNSPDDEKLKKIIRRIEKLKEDIEECL